MTWISSSPVTRSGRKKNEIFLNKSQYNVITLPLINGRKNVKVDLPIRPAISFPFCTSSQHQKLFPSMFQAMICLISLFLSLLPLQTHLFKILLSRSEICITFGFLFFTQQKLKTTDSHAVNMKICSASGTHSGKVWSNFLAPFLRELFIAALPFPPTF